LRSPPELDDEEPDDGEPDDPLLVLVVGCELRGSERGVGSVADGSLRV
jgi:hypothetical protein